jgi:hypothetical protein
LITEPLAIPLWRNVAVALLVCSSGDELNRTGLEGTVELLADDAVEPLVALDEEPADELEAVEELAELEADEELAELESDAEPAELGAAGEKLSFVVPNPTFDANKPPTAIVSVLFWAVMTRSPLPLR